ncbi:MAG: beta-ketoacyl-ACP synthase II [bacterium]|nr:beta-ketoacyl-ACP synthase II [bacterium]
MRRRVVVTGMGAVTPIGNTVDEYWEGILHNKVGIGPITKFDTTEYKATLAAEVKGFDGKKLLGFKQAKRMDLFSQYAAVAAKEAFIQSGITMENEDPYKVGIAVGSGIGGLHAIETEYEKLLAKGPAKVNPLLVPMMITNMAAGNISIMLGAKGKCINVVTACATGCHSIGEAYRTIQCGEAAVMLAGGTESSITPLGVAGFTSLTALTASKDPFRASIPFDKERSGFVMGEGAGVVVLEELEHAKSRNATIFAEVVGYGATSDAFHITSPAEDGSGAAMAMEMAMNEAGVSPAQIDYINAHGTSTHHNDLFETRAIKMAMKESANNIKINSTKSMIGHLLGAAGAVEFITCVKSITDSYIHPTVGTKETDIECDLDYVLGEGVHKELTYVLNNSLGFGGHNASLLIKRYKEEV